MLWMSLALAARIETYDASSSEMVNALAEAGDAGAADIRACGWGWASMDITVDGRGTTVSRVNGSSDPYTACVTARVSSWDVMVLDGQPPCMAVAAPAAAPGDAGGKLLKKMIKKINQ